jgi:peptidyl-prolyl cis-trans isomerase C
MMFSRSLLVVCPAAFLLAQTPPAPPKPAAPAAPANATPVAPATPAPPKPNITMSMQSPTMAPMPVLPPDKVVITVGDQKLTFAEFQAIIDSLPEQYRVSARGPGRKQFADNLVRVMVLQQEGKRRKLDQTPAFKTQSEFQTENVLAGITFEQMNKDLKIDEADLKQYYEAHKNEFEQVHARHILVRFKGSPVALKPTQKDLTEEEALAKAQEIRKKLLDGADFANLALIESDDVGSGNKGGDLGFFHHNQMVPPFEQAAFAMKVGDLSEPVKSQFGYHIIKVEAHETKTFEEVKPEIEKKMRPEASQKAIRDLETKSSVTLDPELFGPPVSNIPHPTMLPQPGK